jgi:hypothetical protein
MKHFSSLLLIIGFSPLLSAQDLQKPDWVRLFQRGTALPDTLDCYYGIGSSSLTQDEADVKARQEFAFNIEARIQNVITRNAQETDNVLRDEYSVTVKVSSDVVLHGISITGRYEDMELKQYYALIQIRKSVFDTLLVTEIRRDFERKKAENKVEEERKAEELRSRQAELELRKKEEDTRRQELEVEKKQYEDFLNLRAPEEVVDLRNGEISRKSLTLALNASLSPFNVQSAYFSVAIWHFEVSANTYFQSQQFPKTDMLDREEASFKVQLLEQAGQFYKTSLAFGVVGYAGESTLGAFDSVRPKYSLFVGGDVALPTALYSFASVYVDGRKASVGWNCFPFPGNVKDGVSILVQMDYVWNNEWRNRFSDPLLFQTGLRFRASDAFASSFTYEAHEYLVFSIEMGF